MRYFALVSVAVLLCLAPSPGQAQVYGDPSSLVDYWYRTYLGRAPDPSGLASWTAQLNQGNAPDAVLAAILGSAEFYAKAGSAPEGFIMLLYQDILKRSPSPNELAFWVGRMYTEDRQTIADEILTQNPGVWVGSTGAVAPSAVATPPVVVTPGIDWRQYRNWDRDRRPDWDRHHEIHEYRRPDIHAHQDDHHDRHR
jgi:Domain of unknown function (DUF4214)